MTLRTLTAPDTETLVTGRPPGKKRRQLRRTTESYGFLAPTLILLFILMVVPIVMVVGYSLQDSAILGPPPEFVGIQNYLTVLGDPGFWKATGNTIFFSVVSVAAHLVLGLGFAMMLNSRLLGTVTRTVFRALYVLPWLFTAAVIAGLDRIGYRGHFSLELETRDVADADRPAAAGAAARRICDLLAGPGVAAQTSSSSPSRQGEQT